MLKGRKELEEISASLEKVLSGEKIKPVDNYEDTLFSKINHQIERIFNQFIYREEQLTKEKNDIKELISDIAHELRTPLTNMETYLSLLEDTPLAEEQKTYVKAISDSERNIHFLTESFIKMARLEINVIQIKKESYDIESTILKSILQVKKTAEAKNIKIELDIMEHSILHDSNWLGEVITNLLDNSIKYSNDNSVIQVKVMKNNMFAQIAVRDYGKGILSGEENLIFKRFYRGMNVNDTHGYGLGLYVCNEVVHLHDGFMKVKRKKEGMEMSVFLPYKND